jgi:hypothetical protein
MYCEGGREEHEACKDNLGYCPYCEQATFYAEGASIEPLTGRLQMPEVINQVTFDTLVVSGQ